MEQNDSQAKKTKDSDSLYSRLPRSLGGDNLKSNVSKEGGIDLGRILPSSFTLNSTRIHDNIQKKGLSLSKGIQLKPSSTPSGRDPTRASTCKKRRREPYDIRKNPKRKAHRVKLSAEERKYSIYEPLCELWKQYARSLKAQGGPFAARVLKMDLHGAPVKVSRSKDPSLVGIQGILIAETANTVMIAVKGSQEKEIENGKIIPDRVVTVPKNVSVIHVVFDDVQIELFMPALAFRASERSARKFKKRYMPFF